MLGNDYLAQGALDKAIDLYKQSVKARPNLLALNNLGIAYSSKGEYETAIGYFQTALMINRNYSEAHFELAKTLVKMGRQDDAMRHFILSGHFN
jgi:tetratricopeptide (TPR) repeat protein